MADTRLPAFRILALATASTLAFVEAMRAFFASVYYHNLSSLGLNASAAWSLVLLAPVVLLLPHADRAAGRLLVGAAFVLAVARVALVPAWGTAAYVPAAALATGAFLVLLPLLLRVARDALGEVAWAPVAAGLLLGFAFDAGIVVAAASADPTTGPEGLVASIGLGLLIMALAWARPEARGGWVASKPTPLATALLAGVAVGAWIFLLFAVLASPHHLARWNERPAIWMAAGVIPGLVLGAAAALPALTVLRKPLVIAAGSVLVFVALLDHLFVHSPILPAVVLAANVALATQLFTALGLLNRAAPRRIAAAMVAASFALLLLLFLFVFAFVNAFVPLGHLWRGAEFWLLPLAAALVALPVVAAGRRLEHPLRVPSLPAGAVVALLLAPLALGAVPLAVPAASLERDGDDGALRVMTFNLHQGFNNDGVLDPAIFLRILRDTGPDLVSLQESDTARFSSGNLDIVDVLAREAGYRVAYGPPTREQSVGVAVLSKLPILAHGYFPITSSDADLPRFATTAQVAVNGTTVWFVAVHMGLPVDDRTVQAREILARAAALGPRVILAGDFNSCPDGDCPKSDHPQDTVVAEITATYRDAWVEAGNAPLDPAGYTFGEGGAYERIDYVFVSEAFAVRDARVLRTPDALAASDHLPVVADLDVRGS